MDKVFSSCSKPEEVFDEVLSVLASDYVTTKPEGNTFDRLKGKFGLTPVQKKKAKTPAKWFEILEQKGILKSPNVEPLIKCFTGVDHRAIPLIKQAERRIQQLQGEKESSSNNWMTYDNLRNNEEDIGKILCETIDGMEDDDHADDTSKELKSTLKTCRSKYIDIDEIRQELLRQDKFELKLLNERLYSLLLGYKVKTRGIYRTCREEVEGSIKEADQQPGATVSLREKLKEDGNLGFGNKNSTDVSQLLNYLERRGKIGPQKYSYFSEIMNKLDPSLKEIVADAQKKLQDLQKDLLSHLKKKMKELEGEKDLEKCSLCGKRKREDEEEDLSHKRQEVNGY